MFTECTLYSEDRKKLRSVLSKAQRNLAALDGEQFFLECMKAKEMPVVEAVADFIFDVFKVFKIKTSTWVLNEYS